MIHPRVDLLALAVLASGLPFAAPAQSVISTHSGTLYYFEGAVFLGDQAVQQKFGQFPDIGEGRELWTKEGRAEVLLTPGVFLRVNENSGIRLVSNELSNTRVALLDGSAILEVREIAPNTAVRLSYKNWQLQDAQRGVYRIDSKPAQLRVYRGEIQVCAEGSKDAVTLRDGEELPFAPVLVAEQAPSAPPDDFKNWAMGRSMAIASDNATAAGIIDDPSQIDPYGVAMGGFSYFPLTGIPSMGVGSPYGVSFWTPYQLPVPVSSMYPYPSIYSYPVYGYGLPAPYLGVGSRYFYPGRTSFPSGVSTGIGMGGTHVGGVGTYRPPLTYRPPASHPALPPVHAPAVRGVGHR